MALKIRANSLFVNRYLKVTDSLVIFVETAAIGGRHKFRYDQIDYMLMSPTNVLSLQVGCEVFSIQTNPRKQRHQLVIQQLQRMAAGAQSPAAGFPVISAGT
jgi:hypothetical protein